MTNEEKFEADDTLVKLRRDYFELKDEFENLINSGNHRSQPRIRGSITSAGATLEIILIYILVKEGREESLKDYSGRYIGLNDMRKLAERYIPEEENIHLSSIMRWRNHVAHGNNIDKLNEHELAAVNSALNSFVEWFFTDYIHYKLPEFSNNIYAESISPNQATNGKDIFEDGSIKTIREWAKIEKKKNIARRKWTYLARVIAILLISGVLFLGYKYYRKPKISQLNKAQIYELMVNYYNRINAANFDSREFYGESVSQFITYQNVTPEKINELVYENIDYIDGKTIIDRESIHLVRLEENVTFWEYNLQFMCYRKTMNKFQSCKVEIEIGLNGNNKIVSYKELKVKDLRFSSKRLN